jgi:hypothetical protein
MKLKHPKLIATFIPLAYLFPHFVSILQRAL